MMRRIKVQDESLGGYIATRSHPTGSKGDQEFYEISLPTDAKWSDSVGLDRPAPVLQATTYLDKSEPYCQGHERHNPVQQVG